MAASASSGASAGVSASATGSAFGGPHPAVGPGAAAISPQRRAAVNASLSGFLQKELGNQVALSLGASVDVGQAAALTANLKTNLQSKIGASLGIGGGIAAGGVGGTAGGGANLTAGAGVTAGLVGGASGNLGGVASGGVSLGAGLGTRASASAGAVGNVVLGTSVSGKFGVGAKAGLASSSATRAGIRVSSGASIKSAVNSALDRAMAQNGLSGSEQSALRSEMQPAINSSVDDSFTSAFGPEIGYPNARGVSLLGCECTMQHSGEWYADCEIDHESEDDEPPTGPFVFSIDAVEFRGTVVKDRSGGFGGRQRVRVIGGAGGLTTELDARNYSGGLTRVRTVVGDIMRDSGESLSIEADDAFLDMRVSGWHRSSGTAKHSLDLVCNKIGANWRVLRDGTVWIGQDEWPEVEPAGTVMDQDWGAGIVTVAPDNATLVPGVIVRGQQIHQVTHRFGADGKLRTDLHAKSHRQLVDGFLERTQRKSEYAYRYRCRVSRQNADGTVDVVTDDSRMKGRGVANCRMRVGLPGVTIKVSPGARCLVGWDDADPELPYVDSWESGAPFVSIDIG